MTITMHKWGIYKSKTVSAMFENIIEEYKRFCDIVDFEKKLRQNKKRCKKDGKFYLKKECEKKQKEIDIF